MFGPASLNAIFTPSAGGASALASGWAAGVADGLGRDRRSIRVLEGRRARNTKGERRCFRQLVQGVRRRNRWRRPFLPRQVNVAGDHDADGCVAYPAIDAADAHERRLGEVEDAGRAAGAGVLALREDAAAVAADLELCAAGHFSIPGRADGDDGRVAGSVIAVAAPKDLAVERLAVVGDEGWYRRSDGSGRLNGARDVLGQFDAGIEDVAERFGLGVLSCNRGCGLRDYVCNGGCSDRLGCLCSWRLVDAGEVCCDEASCDECYDQKPDRESSAGIWSTRDQICDLECKCEFLLSIGAVLAHPFRKTGVSTIHNMRV